MSTTKQPKSWEERFEREFPVSHYYCEDTWYSCPKSPGGCVDKSQGDECTCGAEKYHLNLKKFVKSEISRGKEKGFVEGIEQVEGMITNAGLVDPTIQSISLNKILKLMKKDVKLLTRDYPL